MQAEEESNAHNRLVRVAAVQAAPVAFDLSATLDKVYEWTDKAVSAESKPDLVVFPEAFVSAYPRRLGFAIGARSTEDRTWYKRYLQSSVKIPPVADRQAIIDGATLPSSDGYYAFQRLADIARSTSVLLSIGVIERSLEGATTWCTNLLFAPTGELLSRHRKFQPTAAERVVWSQGERWIEGKEDNLPVVHTAIGKIGGLICWESDPRGRMADTEEPCELILDFMPLARYALYQRGVEIYVAPTADGRTTWLPTMQHIAQEGRCLVVSANQYHTSHDFPPDYPGRLASEKENGAGPEVWSRGGSCIVGPLGEVLAGPLWHEEGVIRAEFDLEDLLGAKLDFDAAGHYSRHELMMSLLNE